MKEYLKTKKIYEEILNLINKHKDSIRYSYNDLDSLAKKHLFEIELQEKYGLNIKPNSIGSLDFVRFGDYLAIGWWGKKYNRDISWSDDGKQPEDELLVYIGFSTGAYIFGDDYPTELFKNFWDELKTYNPKYIDTTNKNLYFSIETAKDVFNDFPEILKKYYEINKADFKERKIKKLQKELETLLDHKEIK